MKKIPQDPALDSTLALLRDGYQFINRRCRRLGTDIFRTRLLGLPVICLHGPEAAELFYDPARFQRRGAVPKPVQKTLLGERGVQTLDGEAHARRKALFMSLMNREQLDDLMARLEEEWTLALARWGQRDAVVLFEEAQDVLCRAACGWVGVPLPAEQVRKRARDFGWMVDGFGSIGYRHWRGRLARQRTEAWIRRFIEQVRVRNVAVPAGSAAHAIAWYQEQGGEPLSAQRAAVELINVLRPIVAIATYITFGAVGLHHHPECRPRLAAGEGDYTRLFAQEVRRYYPFAPFTGAKVRETFEWRGYRFERGTLTLLDLYGPSHDPNRWERPSEFRPERFSGRGANPFDFIPQGGGHYGEGHRCAGEWITVEALKVSFRFLATALTYDVPPQDLGFSLWRFPTLPRSGFVMRGVRATGAGVRRPALDDALAAMQ